MDYYEAIECEVTAAEARQEIDKHDCTDTSIEDFQTIYGTHDAYCGGDVLHYLGY